MDRLDVYQQSLPVEGVPPATSQSLPVAMPTQQPVPDQPSTSAAPPSMLEHMINRLTGTGGEERYQTWPEKTVREALSAAHDAMNSKEPLTSQDLIQPAMAMSAVAGTGGVAGADATLGSAPFLRPALKYEGKIYKAPVGGQHLDAIPADVYPKFQKMAMNGEDINHFNFGFMNHKGQFLDREKALDYAIKEGLLDPNSEAARANTLTSTLMSDSSKPGAAIESMGKSRYEQILEAQRATEGFRAAMRDPETGKIYTGSSHQAAIEKAPAHNEQADAITNGTWGRLSSEWDKGTDNTGFIDRAGKFVSRTEAEKRYNVSTMEDLKDLRTSKSKTAQFR